MVKDLKVYMHIFLFHERVFIASNFQLKKNNFEPPHDKTNKLTMCPAKTQISLGIRPV